MSACTCEGIKFKCQDSGTDWGTLILSVLGYQNRIRRLIRRVRAKIEVRSLSFERLGPIGHPKVEKCARLKI